MKILIATDMSPNFTSGSTQFLKRHALMLQKHGYDVAIICPSNTIHNQYFRSRDGLQIYGIRSVPTIVQKRLRLSPPIAIKKCIEKIIKDFKPDVIHIQEHFFIPYIVIKIAKKLGIPIIGTNHFMPENVTLPFRLPRKIEALFKKLGWKHLNKIYKKLDKVTTPTLTAADIFHRFGFKNPIQVISNGIDLKLFHPNQNGKFLYKKLKIPKKNTILFVGRLDPEKNIEDIIKAMPLIIKKTDAQLIIAGRGSKEKSLKKLTKKLNLEKNIIFSGFISDEDLPKLYCIADAFVMPGTAELQSIVTMEAMASGLPIVAANAMALPELIHDKENGFLFEKKNIEELAEKIIKILSNKNLRIKMGKKSLKIIEKHDINKTFAAFEKIYRKMINK